MVKDIQSGRIFVKKLISRQASDIYKTVRDCSLSGVPKIELITDVKDGSIVIEEFINGITIEDLIKNDGCIQIEHSLSIIISLCQALRVLHNKGIVHRDVTASNVIIFKGKAYLIDFGISRKHRDGANADTEILGTVGYAAPEQFGFKQTDLRCDIYALGVLLNYMICGCMPAIKTPDGRCGDIVKKCTQIDPSNRYSSTDELIVEINKALNSVSQKTLRKKERDNKTLRIIVSSIVYFLLLLFVVVIVEDYQKSLDFNTLMSDISLWLFLALPFACIIHRIPQKLIDAQRPYSSKNRIFIVLINAAVIIIMFIVFGVVTEIFK